jgi:hypothetical protein
VASRHRCGTRRGPGRPGTAARRDTTVGRAPSPAASKAIVYRPISDRPLHGPPLARHCEGSPQRASNEAIPSLCKTGFRPPVFQTRDCHGPVGLAVTANQRPDTDGGSSPVVRPAGVGRYGRPRDALCPCRLPAAEGSYQVAVRRRLLQCTHGSSQPGAAAPRHLPVGRAPPLRSITPHGGGASRRRP